MKIAICYYSKHHGNTRKVIENMIVGQDVDLIDVTAVTEVDLEKYDVIGFASGIYYGKFQKNVIEFAKQYMPMHKKTFFVYTYGSKGNGFTKAIKDAMKNKQSKNLGEYGCRGFDTFGPFKWIGGVAKGHPDENDLQKAKEFYNVIAARM